MRSHVLSRSWRPEWRKCSGEAARYRLESARARTECVAACRPGWPRFYKVIQDYKFLYILYMFMFFIKLYSVLYYVVYSFIVSVGYGHIQLYTESYIAIFNSIQLYRSLCQPLGGRMRPYPVIYRHIYTFTIVYSCIQSYILMVRRIHFYTSVSKDLNRSVYVSV